MQEQWQSEGLTPTPEDIKKFSQTGDSFLFEIEGHLTPLQGHVKSFLSDGEYVETSIGGLLGPPTWFRRSQISILALIPPPAIKTPPAIKVVEETKVKKNDKKRFSKVYRPH